MFRISDHFPINASNLNLKILLFPKLLRVKIEVYIILGFDRCKTQKTIRMFTNGPSFTRNNVTPFFICLIDSQGIYHALEKV